MQENEEADLKWEGLAWVPTFFNLAKLIFSWAVIDHGIGQLSLWYSPCLHSMAWHDGDTC